MQLFSKVLFGVLIITLVVVSMKLRSASAGVEVRSKQLVSVSNMFASAETKLREADQTTQTLKVQLKLVQEDERRQSTQISNITAQLARLQLKLSEVESEAREKDVQVTAFQDRNRLLSEEAIRYEGAMQSAQSEREKLERETAGQQKQISELVKNLNASETELARLRQQVYDEAFLRARLLAVQASARNRGSRPTEGKLSIRPDGTVELLSSEN